jgi:hypothetical protein
VAGGGIRHRSHEAAEKKAVRNTAALRCTSRPVRCLVCAGELYVWGEDVYGALGLGNTAAIKNIAVPTKVATPGRVKKVAYGCSGVAVTDTVTRCHMVVLTGAMRCFCEGRDGGWRRHANTHRARCPR